MKARVYERRLLLCAALLCAWAALGAAEARACSCARAKPCEAYGRADAVFVGLVTSQSVKEEETKERGRTFSVQSQVSRFHVEEAFSGAGAGKEVEIETDLSTSCAFPLKPGARYLIYAYRGEGADVNRLFTGMCSRTTTVERAAEDLEYLRGVGAAARGAVVEGRVSYYDGVAPHDRGVGADTIGVTTVVAEGEGRRVEARVGAGGQYQLTGLPPGKYRVTASLPDELTMLENYHPEMAGDQMVKEQHQVEVTERGCATKHITVLDNGRLSGRVTDSDGLPVARVEVNVLRLGDDGAAKKNSDGDEETFDITTDEDGLYSFKGLPAGRYLVGVRIGPYVSPEDVAAAYPRTFYPGVADERDAVVLSLGKGQNITRRDFQLRPRLAERIIQGVVLRKDGRPAANVEVRYQARTSDLKYSSHVFIKTDAQGRFSINGHEGTAYLVGAYTRGCKEPECAHAHEAEVAPTGPVRTIRLVLDQRGTSCERCRDYDKFAEGKP